MTTPYLTGDQGQSTEQAGGAQPTVPTSPSLPALDGTQQGMDAAVFALLQAVGQLQDQQRITDVNVHNLTEQGGAGGTKKKVGKYTEISRSTEDVTVTDPNTGATLTYTQITQLVMRDTETNELWTWKLTNG